MKLLTTAYLLCLCLVLSGCQGEIPQSPEAHMEKARAYAAGNDLGNAVIEYRNAIGLNPENDLAHYELGELYLKLRKPTKAMKEFSRAAAANPGNIQAQLTMGNIHLRQGSLFEARKIVAGLLEIDPNLIDAYHLLSGIQIQEGDLPAAMETLEKAVEIEPSNARTHFALAQFFMNRKNYVQAEQSYLKAVSLDSESRRSYIRLCRLYAMQDKWGKVEHLLRDVVKTPGITHLKLTDLARFYEEQHRLDLAEDNFKKAVAAARESITPLINLAEFYVRRKEMDPALATLEKALALKPGDPVGLSALAQTHLRFRNVQKAESIIDGVLAGNPGNPDALYQKGKLFMDRKDYEGGLDCFDKLINLDRYNARAYYYKALCVRNLRAETMPGQDIYRAASGMLDNPEAYEKKQLKDHLRTAILLEPDLIDARLSLAELHLYGSEFDGAASQITAVLDLDPGNLKALTLAGGLKILEGDIHGAEEICNTVLKLKPGYIPGRIRLGLVLAAAGKEKKALKTFREILDLDPGNMDVLSFMVDILMKKRDLSKSIELIRQQEARGGFSDKAGMEILKGSAFLSAGDLDAAEIHFSEAMKLDPERLSPYMNLGRIYRDTRKIDRAIPMYQEAARRYPGYLPAHLYPALIYHSLGDSHNARTCYRAVLSIQPSHPDAANNLAFLLAQDNIDLDEAFSLARIAKEQRPGDPDVLDTMGWIYYRKERYQNAIAELEESLRLRPENVHGCYHIGLAYYRVKEFEKARFYLKKVLELDPSFEEAGTIKSLLN